MTLIANLDGAGHLYRLCFVRSPWAWFTCLPLDEQCGERWADVPYQNAAKPPYSDSRAQLLRVAFDAPSLLPPEAGRHGHAWSVQQINHGAAPWLRSEDFVDALTLTVPAGATLATFVERIEAAGGTVYGPLGWAELPPWQRPDIVPQTG
ncbi:hypothetical protein BMUNKI379_07010 [Burkholderia multivorans]|uniref:Uncharacterized protein n=1 Tax=Burkholderia pseudomultivorans TaxID=1207504 RepID=A0A132EBK7_9BURK|nr:MULTISPECIES: hypothetical protein [Burkholderia cepacia complex]AOI67491.1 hypothetical protein WS51_27760 [Burkholderia territorii]KPJ35566.1 hypothetical protein BMUNKI379_07010 [Burkholderia multivorans]KVC49080.1 hypothetical protein WI71_07020 [Burkholderia diffusa]KVG25836.1 hypothetical protein WJ30_28750 [Burkholderia diffusa]KVG57713.1 hypothetical protein WS79_16480 [Burkholderia territorii]